MKVKYLVLMSLTIVTTVALIYKYPLPQLIKQSPKSSNIVIVALPKSGSTYLLGGLQKTFNYACMSTATTKPKNPKVLRGSFEDFFKQKELIIKAHYRAPHKIRTVHMGQPLLDIQTVKRNTNVLILHLRDPRQALLSLVHHVNLHKENSFVLPDRPEGYYSLTLSEQIDWGIENFLPNMVIWINDWLEFKDLEAKKNGLNIFITTYDELIADEDKLYKKIAALHGINTKNVTFKHPNKYTGVNFRKGDPNEWRAVFTEKQKQRIAEIVPSSMLKRFKWPE